VPTRFLIHMGVALAIAWLAAGSSASARSSPAVSVDVIAWPGEATGPLQWKLWRVTATEPMTSITIRLPPGAVRPEALRALAAAPHGTGDAVGGGVSTAQQSAGARTTIRTPLAFGGCPGGSRGTTITLHFETIGGCANVRVDVPASGTLVNVDLPADAAFLTVAVRLDSIQTSGGRVLPSNPRDAVALDTTATVGTAVGSAADTVREVVGGATDVTVSLARGRVDYGGAVTISGVVRRGGSPAPGERIVLDALRTTAGDVPAEAALEAVTDAEGRFDVSLQPTSGGLYAAWATAAATGDRPHLNTLAAVTQSELVVRAPRPVIEKRRARLRGRRVRAVIVVRNPIAGLERLQCRFYVGKREVTVRRFPPSRKPLVFHVVAFRNTRVRAVIGRWNDAPIAGRSSKALRLWPRSARARGSVTSRRR
jgi:hypothetical protein